MSQHTIRPERAPWGNFPSVLRNGDLGSMKNSEPEYRAAKAGDAVAAIRMVARLVTPDLESSMAQLAGDQGAILVPVLAQEASGNNRIPLMMAVYLGRKLGLEVESNIVQAVRAHRTDSGADHRLAFSPAFDGAVIPGQRYIIMDDTLAMGGTLASLRAYIENRGGNVVGAAVMTAHEGAVNLPPKQAMLDAIHAKHGSAMNEYWTEEFGYGIEQLTQGECGHLKAAVSVDTIRDRIAAARHAASQDPRRAGAGPNGREEGQVTHSPTAVGAPHNAAPPETDTNTARQHMDRFCERLEAASQTKTSHSGPKFR